MRLPLGRFDTSPPSDHQPSFSPDFESQSQQLAFLFQLLSPEALRKLSDGLGRQQTHVPWDAQSPIQVRCHSGQWRGDFRLVLSVAGIQGKGSWPSPRNT